MYERHVGKPFPVRILVLILKVQNITMILITLTITGISIIQSSMILNRTPQNLYFLYVMDVNYGGS
jgi:hypothetical protein